MSIAAETLFCHSHFFFLNTCHLFTEIACPSFIFLSIIIIIYRKLFLTPDPYALFERVCDSLLFSYPPPSPLIPPPLEAADIPVAFTIVFWTLWTLGQHFKNRFYPNLHEWLRIRILRINFLKSIYKKIYTKHIYSLRKCKPFESIFFEQIKQLFFKVSF